MTAPRITEITHFHEKTDMSRWTRAHEADVDTINWSVFPGPGGTMIVVEHEGSREDFLAAQAAATAPDEAGAAPGVSDAVPSVFAADGIATAPAGETGPVEPPAATYFFEVASV